MQQARLFSSVAGRAPTVQAILASHAAKNGSATR